MAKGKNLIIHLAAEYGCLVILKAILEKGFDINAGNAYGFTPLHIASRSGQFEIVRYLVLKGADLENKCLTGHTALLLAIAGRHENIAVLLIHFGANVNCRDYENWTALHTASLYSCEKVIRLLVKKGAVLNTQILCYITPLYLAMHNKSITCTKLLLRLGADSNMECLKSVTIFSNFIGIWANVEIFKLCIENGAYLKPSDYYTITKNSTLKENILKDAKICSQSIINKFNRFDLPELYKIPMCTETLPLFDKLTILSDGEIMQDIENTLKFQIQTNGHCILTKVRPMALTLLCVESLNKYYELK